MVLTKKDHQFVGNGDIYMCTRFLKSTHYIENETFWHESQYTIPSRKKAVMEGISQ